MKNTVKRIFPFFKNFYFVASVFFLIWLTFIDSNDLFVRMELQRKHHELLETRSYYEERILEVKNDREALINNPKLLEKLAREKYLMKKDGEDVYILVPEQWKEGQRR